MLMFSFIPFSQNIRLTLSNPDKWGYPSSSSSLRSDIGLMQPIKPLFKNCIIFNLTINCNQINIPILNAFCSFFKLFHLASSLIKSYVFVSCIRWNLFCFLTDIFKDISFSSYSFFDAVVFYIYSINNH